MFANVRQKISDRSIHYWCLINGRLLPGLFISECTCVGVGVGVCVCVGVVTSLLLLPGTSKNINGVYI